MLEDQLKILADKEHLGITKSEWQQVDDVEALKHYKTTMKWHKNAQFEVRLPTNELIEQLKSNEGRLKPKLIKNTISACLIEIMELDLVMK